MAHFLKGRISVIRNGDHFANLFFAGRTHLQAGGIVGTKSSQTCLCELTGEVGVCPMVIQLHLKVVGTGLVTHKKVWRGQKQPGHHCLFTSFTEWIPFSPCVICKTQHHLLHLPPIVP